MNRSDAPPSPRRPALRALFAAVLAVAATLSGPAQASDWPRDKPVELIVPYPAGGSSDVIARLLAKSLGETLKQSFVVVNKSGAATAIGTAYVARSNNDGYTLLLADGPFVVNPAANPRVPYDPVDDFAPVAIVGTSPSFLYVPVGRYDSLQAFLDAARARPGQLSAASAGAGTLSHLLFEVMMKEANVKLNHIPYRGSAPAMTDTVAGTVDASFSSYASAQPFVASGKLKVLAMTAPQPLAAFPGVPTFKDAGMPAMTFETWWGVLGPKGMPADATSKLNAALGKALQDPAILKQFEVLSVVPGLTTPQAFGQTIQRDFTHWKDVVKKSGIVIE
ncbi:Bug family tripartite tricarboxylate transporter substrate binding protein [Bordetella genomosp. 13]|uniref:Bug family tripartite tricarboxylate transporter substrate binding protein n=1 Tax=Bordetella genomosp. 13 TaxID=463040 RepID=UPI0011A04892|nr:tripartite tricarboxylate transporter substrate binding protein [Bordetella genomosp. 13]